MPWSMSERGRAAIRANRLGAEGPRTIRAQITPTLRDIYWAAGFIEGEGTFRIGSVCEATQRQREPLERLLMMFGGTLSVKRYGEAYRANRTDHWQWRVSGSRGRGVAWTLYRLMSPKRQTQIRDKVTPKVVP